MDREILFFSHVIQACSSFFVFLNEDIRKRVLRPSLVDVVHMNKIWTMQISLLILLIFFFLIFFFFLLLPREEKGKNWLYDIEIKFQWWLNHKLSAFGKQSCPPVSFCHFLQVTLLPFFWNDLGGNIHGCLSNTSGNNFIIEISKILSCWQYWSFSLFFFQIPSHPYHWEPKTPILNCTNSSFI